MKSVFCSESHTLALASDGNVFSWGSNGNFFSGNKRIIYKIVGGYLGHGNKNSYKIPVLIDFFIDNVRKNDTYRILKLCKLQLVVSIVSHYQKKGMFLYGETENMYVHFL